MEQGYAELFAAGEYEKLIYSLIKNLSNMAIIVKKKRQSQISTLP